MARPRTSMAGPLKTEDRAISWQEYDLMERPVGEAVQGPEIGMTIMPYEIRTFLLKIRDDINIVVFM